MDKPKLHLYMNRYTLRAFLIFPPRFPWSGGESIDSTSLQKSRSLLLLLTLVSCSAERLRLRTGWDLGFIGAGGHRGFSLILLSGDVGVLGLSSWSGEAAVVLVVLISGNPIDDGDPTGSSLPSEFVAVALVLSPNNGCRFADTFRAIWHRSSSWTFLWRASGWVDMRAGEKRQISEYMGRGIYKLRRKFLKGYRVRER